MKFELSENFCELTTEEQEILYGGANPIYSLISMIFSAGNIVGSAGNIVNSVVVSPALGALAVFFHGVNNGLSSYN